MFLDKIIIEQLGMVGKLLLKEANIKTYPKNCEEMSRFLNTIINEIGENKFDGLFVGSVFYNFVSSDEVRDRLTTSRIFEDIFCSLFNIEPTDCRSRENPATTKEILKLDKLCKNETWKISDDLSGNKREKADVFIGDYSISLKTLKGKNYNSKMEIIDNKFNSEINIGSVSYRALFKGILSDEQISTLKDRKGGLGSSKQIRANVLDPIKNLNKQKEFCMRLSLFFNYIFNDDFYVVYKSNYRMTFYLVPNESFINCFIKAYESCEDEFEQLWGRWENNNLRIQWPKMMELLDRFNLVYYTCVFNLTEAVDSLAISRLHNDVKDTVVKYMQNILSDDKSNFKN